MAAGAAAMVSLCAPLQAAAAARGSGGSAAAITWVARLDAVVGGSCSPGLEVALEIEPCWLDSKRTLRDAVRAARDAAPGITAAVLRGSPLRHHDLLAAEGVRVVVVDSFGDVRRGSRRPSPGGWPCRNVAWGLWEVRCAAPRDGRPWIWPWPLGGMPSPRRGGLHVLSADVGERPGAHVERWIGWMARHAGRVVVVPVAALPDIFEGARTGSRGGSILHAA